jgi:hypothetical protein
MERGATLVALVIAAVLSLTACGSRFGGNPSPRNTPNTDPVGVGHAYQKANNALP